MEVPCIVNHVIYRNDSGFAILSASLNVYSGKYDPDLDDTVTAYFEEKKKSNLFASKYYSDGFKVSIGMLPPDEDLIGRPIVFVGELFEHPKYGKQFKADFYYQDEPKDIDGMRLYLMTLPNIKEARSREILKRFTIKEVINILDNDPYQLTTINGITEKRIPPIKKAWDRDKSLRQLYAFLSEHDISPLLGQKIFDKWGRDSETVLKENPYRLTEIKGVGFIMADAMAHKILGVVSPEFRVVACLQYLLAEDVYRNGNLCSPYGKLKKSVYELLNESNRSNNVENDVKAQVMMIAGCLRSNLDKFTCVKDEVSGVAYIYLNEIWEREKYIAKEILERHRSDKNRYSCGDEDIEDAEKDLQRITGRDVKLDDYQKDGVKSAFNHKVTVITGGGGTGKSTICRCIYYLAKKKAKTIRMMSPTGKASQVLADKTKGPASTIHMSLKMRPGDEFAHEDISEDIVIVDEVSMVGIDTMFAIFEAISHNPWCNIVFVGDANQLPSVSPGNFLRDIIKSGCANIVRLNQIHRQDEKSFISLLANEISKGKIVDVPDDASDIRWHNVNANNFEMILRTFVNDLLLHGNIDDLQVISPKYKGTCGVDNINSIIQGMMAHEHRTENEQLKRGFQLFHKGDRVIQLENNYKKEIFNGDIGFIEELGRKVVDPSVSDKHEDYIVVNFYGNKIGFIGNEIEQLKLAWCITVHKYQGSQSPSILFIMSREAYNMMSKELVYTAFTRAEKMLYLAGSVDMLRLAPTRSVVRKRYTNMCNIIREIRENRQILRVMQKEGNDE